MVPELKGKLFDLESLKTQNPDLNYVVFDSVFMTDTPPLTILNQFPKAGTQVKKERTIYISVASIQPPQIKMPALVSYSLKTAEMTLKSYGLKLGALSYRSGAHENVVLKQLFDGKEIETGQMIAKGSSIDLMVSTGVGDSTFAIPNVKGLSIEMALEQLKAMGLEPGSIVYDASQTFSFGKVYKQKPDISAVDSTKTIRAGEIIDLWVGGPKPE